jgi:hypothetical protein
MSEQEKPGYDAGLFAGDVKISADERYFLDPLWKSW